MAIDKPLRKPEAIADIPILETSAIAITGDSVDDRTIYTGDFTKMMIGIRSEIRVEVARELCPSSYALGHIAG